ncbi:RidA family protein [Egibacter rhizosphaerae]|uniref:RidA family protein n=1 Tax=Egibacter rhizosphaerae TaxID=1670831 RepID=A0A411YF30_9ACTN|nr:RidA family protein [Egibacter rhizosphaerae]QBI19835.1 RidA family protein [Egibacter rhizosphaerae]
MSTSDPAHGEPPETHGAPEPPGAGRPGHTHRLITDVPGNAAAAGFAHAVVPAAGRTVYLAGQTALNPDGGLEGEDIVAQLDRAAGNLLRALAAAGGEPHHLVSLQLFVTDVEAYRARLRDLGGVWRAHFGRHYPAMGLFGVARLFDEDALVELMGVAVVPPAEP